MLTLKRCGNFGLNGSQGKIFKYGQAFTPETGSAVTFASVVFE